MNINTAVSDRLAGVDIGIKNIFAVSYINRNGELRQTSLGSLPAWIINSEPRLMFDEIIKDGKQRGRHFFSPVIDSPDMYSCTLNAAAVMRNCWILDSIRAAVCGLTEMLVASSINLIAIEHNMKAMCMHAADAAARKKHYHDFKTADIITTKLLYRTVCTELSDAAAAAGIGIIAVDARNTSRICAKCGGRLNKFDLRDKRLFVKCGACRTVWPRDYNASANIMIRGICEAAEAKTKYAVVPIGGVRGSVLAGTVTAKTKYAIVPIREPASA